MKPLLFCLLSAFFLLSSCKKDDSEKFPNYYIKHNFGGVVKEYKIDVLASKTKIGNEYYLVLSGRRKLNTNQTLVVSFADASPIQAKAYQQNNNYEYHIAYGDENNDFYTTQHATNPEVKITITEMTSSAVKGTFSGRVREDVTGTEAVISDGEFYAKLQ